MRVADVDGVGSAVEALYFVCKTSGVQALAARASVPRPAIPRCSPGDSRMPSDCALVSADTDRAAVSPTSGPIARRVLHEEVAARLREWITEGVLAPGERLNERVLCDRLAVSRTPLREACKMLAAQNLVVLHPHRGASVAAPSAEDVCHLFELMAALEGLSGELAALRHDAAELREIRALHREMLTAHAAGDLPAYYRLNRAIHAAINACARNPMLTQTYDSVNLRIQHLRFRSNFNRAKWDAAVADHERMLEVLARRDASAMRALLEAHLRAKLEAVLEGVGGAGAADAAAVARPAAWMALAGASR
jgi:DNA-binding GntR family transcriptional regulator